MTWAPGKSSCQSCHAKSYFVPLSDSNREQPFNTRYNFMGTFNLAPVKPNISLDALEMIDVRVGTIECVEDLKGSTKIVKLIVNFGDHNRTILAGLKKERDNTREIEGKQALFVINLEPKKMMGEVSEGMLFDIGYADGITPVLAMPEKEVPNGARAG